MKECTFGLSMILLFVTVIFAMYSVSKMNILRRITRTFDQWANEWTLKPAYVFASLAVAIGAAGLYSRVIHKTVGVVACNDNKVEATKTAFVCKAFSSKS